MFILFTGSLSARQLYVSPTGQDNNPGTEARPFGSLHHAVNILQAGDSLLLRDGAYHITEPVFISQQGHSDAWLTIMAYPGEHPRILADSMTAPPAPKYERHFHALGALHLEGCSYVRLDGLSVVNSHAKGIAVVGPGTHHIEIVRCYTDETYSCGIAAWNAEHIKVIACEVVRANNMAMRLDGQRRGHEAPHEAISIAGVKYFEVAYNHVHLCYKEGIDCKEVSAHGTIHHNYIHDLLRQGLYIDCWFGRLEDVEVYENIVHDCEWGMAISAEGKKSDMKDIYIHHNLFYNNRASGLLFGVWGNDCLRENVYVYNNTIHHNGSPGHWAGSTGGIDIRSQSLKNVWIFNNICSDNWAFEIATFAKPDKVEQELTDRQIVIVNNLSADFKDKQPLRPGFFNDVYAFLGQQAISGDPLYVAPQKADFRLQSESPAIGQVYNMMSFDYQFVVGAFSQKK